MLRVTSPGPAESSATRRRRAGSSSVRCLGVAGAGVRDPCGSAGVVDEIPDPAAAGDLVLPAFECLAFPGASPETALEPVLALRRHPGPGICADRVKGPAQVPGGLSGQLLPAGGTVIAREPQVVLP